jgi:hypothetical protein
MWQRIQTLYLLISTVLIGLLFFVNKAVLPGADGVAQEITYTVYIPYLILLIIITLLHLIALTTFRVRVLQMRTAIFAALVTLGLQAWLAVDYFTADPGVIFRVSVLFPLAAIVLDVLAARSILADQLMVESVSRLRSRKKNGK